MRHQIKKVFNKCAAKSRKSFTTLSAGFVLATSMAVPAAIAQEASPPPAPAPINTSYWKSADYDMVLKLEKPCPAGNEPACVTIHNVNPKDRKVRLMLAELKDLKSYDEMGNVYYASEKISHREVNRFCQYTFETLLTQDGSNAWKGKISGPYGGEAEIKVKQDDDKIKISGHIPVAILSFIPVVTVKANRIDNPPPPCYPR